MHGVCCCSINAFDSLKNAERFRWTLRARCGTAISLWVRGAGNENFQELAYEMVATSWFPWKYVLLSMKSHGKDICNC